MTLRIIESTPTKVTYTIDTLKDLPPSVVTNLFNTGDPLVVSGRADPRMIELSIPQSLMFSEGPGRFVDPGDFGLIQDLYSGVLRPDPGLYTVSDLIREFPGQVRISFVLKNGLLEISSDDYADRAYLFQTQELVLDIKGGAILDHGSAAELAVRAA